MISAWFLVDKKFSGKRFVSMWLTVLFFNATVTVIVFSLKLVPFSIVYFVQAFLPIMGRPQWYMCEYLLLLLFHPFLNRFLSLVKLAELKVLLILMFIFIVMEETIFPIETTPPLFSEFTWFLFVYFLMYYLKKQKVASHEHKKLLWLLVFACMCFILVVNMADDFLGGNGTLGMLFQQLASHYSSHYEALPGFCMALCLFLIFKDLDLKENKIVNLIAKASGTIYILHQVPVFCRYSEYGFTIWNGIFHMDQFLENGSIVFPMIGYTLIVLAIGVIADVLYRHTILRILSKSRIYRKAVHDLEAIFNI
jgi:hypothetical protein